MNIYTLKLSTVYIVMVFGILIWTFNRLILCRRKPGLIKAWKAINLAGVLTAFYGILSYTVLGREFSNEHVFVFFTQYGPEFYREMLMNAFLYFPLGLTLSTLIGPWSIVLSFLLSLSIEAWQYFTGSGLAQGTDVIMNTLGCAVGCMHLLIRSESVDSC